jgi:hypothetical protein
MAGSSEREQLSGKIAADLLIVLDDYERLQTVLDCTGGTMVQAIFRERDALKAELERALAENKKLRLDVDGEPADYALDYRERKGK